MLVVNDEKNYTQWVSYQRVAFNIDIARTDVSGIISRSLNMRVVCGLPSM